MRDWIWNRLNDLRVWMIKRHAPARRINFVSRLCRMIWPRGYHAGRKKEHV